MRRGCELIVLACLGGCWDKAPIDLAGTYRVTEHVASACTTDVPVATPAAYIRVVSSRGGYDVQTCSGIDPMTCGSAGEFTEPIDDDGWRRYQESYLAVGGECGLSVVEGTAYLDDDTWLSVELTTYARTFSLSAPECTAPMREHYDALPCESHAQISATRSML